MISGVYIITNKLNGKHYVGSSCNVTRRLTRHFADLKKGVHHSIKLQRAFNKYGKAAFVSDIIEIVEDKQLLIVREQMHINEFDSLANGYNTRPDAASNLGIKFSDETRQKMRKPKSAAHIESFRNKLFSDTHKANLTKPKSEAAKARMRKPKSAAARLNMGQPGNQHWLGRTHTEETKAKLRAIALGRYQMRNVNRANVPTTAKV